MSCDGTVSSGSDRLVRQLVNVRSKGGHADCLVEIDPHCQSHTDTRIPAGVLSGDGTAVCLGQMRVNGMGVERPRCYIRDSASLAAMSVALMLQTSTFTPDHNPPPPTVAFL